MTFTDDDLKRLKEIMNEGLQSELARALNKYGPTLLARLEAAEKVCSTIDYVRVHWTQLPFAMTVDDELKRWRNTAGK